MKTLSRSLATVAVLGAAVLLLQGGDGNPVSQPGADQTGIAASASVTDRTSSVSAAPQREDAIYSQQMVRVKSPEGAED